MSPGFQMSFAATTALVAVFGAWRNVRLPETWPRLPKFLQPIIGVAASSAIAGLATAPFGAAHFNQIAQFGLIANLASVPVMGLIVMPGAVLDVDYEMVVADLDTQVRRILDYCELPFEEACLRFHETDRAVKTASSEQVRQPIYASSVNLWKNYESHLEELIEVLEPLLLTRDS